MNYRVLIIVFIIGFPLSVFSQQISKKSSVTVSNMMVEYMEQPRGLDVVQPRFSWKLSATNSDGYGQAQSAYRILVSDSKNSKNDSNMWDSGWIMSDNMQLIAYQGKDLMSDRTYYWKVKVKDEKGVESEWSQISQWTTGLLDQSEWTAKWIGSSEVYDPSLPEGSLADPWLRKSIKLTKKPLKAVMFVASVGYHELYVNGKKVGDEVLAPAVSDHTTRARYVTYDIADYLEKGENVVALWLGASWSIYEPYSTPDKPRTPLVIAQSDIYYKNPVSKSSKPDIRIITDASWKIHSSPNSLLGRWGMGWMGGECWDANKELDDWNAVSFNDNDWQNAQEFTPKLILSAQNTYGNKKHAEISPVSITEQADGSFRVDMGVNFAGWTTIKVRGNQGDRIEFLFSEAESAEMTFRNYNAYIINSSGEGVFSPKFNYSSGRWITIKGLKKKPELSDIKGVTIRTDYPETTSFECSDELQNWMYNRIKWTFENLSIGGYIVDCPQRERLGYGGDAHATSETGLFNYHLGAFYTKWMQDWRDVQGWESNKGKRVGGGVLPHTAPTNDGGGGPSWGGICVTLPWFIYQHEGDTRILEQNFEMIIKWLDFLESHTEGNLLKRFGGTWDFLGDWLWPNATAEGMNNDKPETECFNNCYFVFNLATAAKIAKVLGRDDYMQKWNKRADEIRKATHAKFFIADDYSYSDKSMGSLAVALLGEVPPAELRDKVMQRLEREILINCNGHIDVGITGGAMLFKLLRELGRDDLIYSMTSQTEYPSWGFMRKCGATTIWEAWEKDLPGHSLLHSSYLYPGAWYIDGVAGIRRDSANLGFKRFYIRTPLLKESDMAWAKATYDSPIGTIYSYWKKENRLVTHEVVVPPNSTAIICIPDNRKAKIVEDSGYAKFIKTENGYCIYEVPAGRYTFRQEKM